MTVEELYIALGKAMADGTASSSTPIGIDTDEYFLHAWGIRISKERPANCKVPYSKDDDVIHFVIKA